MSAIPGPDAPTPIPNVLGVDPAPVVDETVETPDTPPVDTPTTPSGKTLTQEEYDALQEHASRYELIAADPQLATMILDHFKAKTGRTTNNNPPAPAPQQSTTNQPPQVDNEKAEYIRRQAELEIKLFKLEHPDMEQYKNDMAALVTKYGMSLDDAYRLSKGNAKQQVPQSPVKAKTGMPTTETNVNAGNFDDSENNFAKLEAKLNDPKATPRIDDVMQAAWNLAKKRQAVNQ